MNKVAEACNALKNAEAILVTAGAGIGVDSGLPDFRGNSGFWKAYPPMAKLGLSFIQCASPKQFVNNPYFAWGFYGHRLNLYRRTIPHEGFYILRRFFDIPLHGGFVYTSNVDGQFQKAGFPEDQIVECHGSIHYLQSITGDGDIWSAADTTVNVNETTFLASEPLPRAPDAILARPNLLMFGDSFWIPTRTGEQEERFSDWKRKLKKEKVKRVVAVDIGSGSAIPTARNTAASFVEEFSEGKLIRINPRESQLEGCDGWSFDEGALSALKKLSREMGY